MHTVNYNTNSPCPWEVIDPKGRMQLGFETEAEAVEFALELDAKAKQKRSLMSTRSLTSHRVNGLNTFINICVMDEPGVGGACQHYRIEPIANDHPQGAINPFNVRFHAGPFADATGANGCSNESLLAIVEDRLKGFQTGPFACRENSLALTHLQEAMHWLHHRTRERIQRGVEGTHQK